MKIKTITLVAVFLLIKAQVVFAETKGDWSSHFDEGEMATITIKGECSSRINTVIDNDWFEFDHSTVSESEITLKLKAYKRTYNTKKHLDLDLKILSFDGHEYHKPLTSIVPYYKSSWKINGWERYYKDEYGHIPSFDGYFSQLNKEIVVKTIKTSSTTTYGVGSRKKVYSRSCLFRADLNELEITQGEIVTTL